MFGSALMYALVRQLGASRVGAAVSALVYGLHAQMIGFVYAGWIHQIAPMAWAPGVIWGLVRAFQDRRRWPGGAVFAAAAFLGIQFISGHPEWVRYTLFIAAFVAVLGTAISPGLWRRLTILAAIIALGAAIGG